MGDIPAQDKRNPLLHGFNNGKRRLTALEPDLALQVCERVAQGERLAHICKDPKMPSRMTFIQWTLMHPDVHMAFTAAKQISALSKDELAEEKLEGLLEDPGTPHKVAAFRAYVNHLRWSAERRSPGEYGAKAPVNVAVPISISTNLSLDSSGNAPYDQESLYDLRAEIGRQQEKELVQDAEFTSIEGDQDRDTPHGDTSTPGPRLLAPKGKSDPGKALQARWAHKRKLTPKDRTKPKDTPKPEDTPKPDPAPGPGHKRTAADIAEDGDRTRAQAQDRAQDTLLNRTKPNCQDE